MNEQIQELAEQAGLIKILDEHASEYGNGMFENTPYPELEKFAELIVKECIEQASIGNGHGNNQWDRALTFASKNIKEHFGVK